MIRALRRKFEMLLGGIGRGDDGGFFGVVE